MFGKKKEKLAPGEKAFRLKIAFGFLMAVAAVLFFPKFTGLFQSAQTSKVVTSNAHTMNSVSAIHENTVATAMLNEMKVRIALELLQLHLRH